MKLSKRRVTRSQFDAAQSHRNRWKSEFKVVYVSNIKFYQEFKNWLSKARHHLLISMTIRQRNSRLMRLSFDQYPVELEVSVYPDDISVSVTWNGLCVDQLISIDLRLPVYKKTPDGRAVIICAHCTPEDNQTQYTTLNQFWIEHLFEVFGQWVNETLSVAAWLGMYDWNSGGATWAELHKELPMPRDTTLCILPLPLNNVLNKALRSSSPSIE